MNIFLVIKILLLLQCVWTRDQRNWRVSQFLAFYGYPHEVHWITTDDGYILEAQRILGSRNESVPQQKIPILLCHSLCASSFDYVALGPGRALAYLLADLGFDVWLLNNRGNFYSTNHTRLNLNVASQSREFWNFSWHEMGIYDLPNTVDYILNLTGHSQVIQLGHSEGATQFYVMLAKKPWYNRKIRAHFSYAPATFLCHIQSAVTLLITFPERFGLNSLSQALGGAYRIFASTPIYRAITRLCPVNEFTQSFCGSIYSPLYNSNKEQQDQSLVPIILSHTPSGCSSKCVVHYTQSVRSCDFSEYQNYILESRKPYNLSNVLVPVYAYYSSYDDFVVPLDVLHLNQSLPRGFRHSVESSILGHVDFVYGTGTKRLVYDDTIAQIVQLTNTTSNAG